MKPPLRQWRRCSRCAEADHGTLKRDFLKLLDNSLNRLTRPAALRGIRPFALVCHVGRKTGKAYQTPVILARVPEGFVAELTYGPQVQWYRNVVAAGECRVVFHARRYQVSSIEEYDPLAGREAFGFPAKTLLQVLRKDDFRLLRSDGSPLD
jgi:hypothetical protein